jgi:hypothetical protein
MSPSSSGSKNKPSKKPALLPTCFHADLLFGLFFNSEDGGDVFLEKRRLIFNGLHSVISQKIVLFKAPL